MNPQNRENPSPEPPSRLPPPVEGYSGITASGAMPSRAVLTPHTTSTYRSPPWAWATTRSTSVDQLVPLAALAVILAALVAIVGMLVLIAILALRLL
jgi:hypothetical protein